MNPSHPTDLETFIAQAVCQYSKDGDLNSNLSTLAIQRADLKAETTKLKRSTMDVEGESLSNRSGNAKRPSSAAETDLNDSCRKFGAALKNFGEIQKTLAATKDSRDEFTLNSASKIKYSHLGNEISKKKGEITVDDLLVYSAHRSRSSIREREMLSQSLNDLKTLENEPVHAPSVAAGVTKTVTSRNALSVLEKMHRVGHASKDISQLSRLDNSMLGRHRAEEEEDDELDPFYSELDIDIDDTTAEKNKSKERRLRNRISTAGGHQSPPFAAPIRRATTLDSSGRRDKKSPNSPKTKRLDTGNIPSHSAASLSSAGGTDSEPSREGKGTAAPMRHAATGSVGRRDRRDMRSVSHEAPSIPTTTATLFGNGEQKRTEATLRRAATMDSSSARRQRRESRKKLDLRRKANPQGSEWSDDEKQTAMSWAPSFEEPTFEGAGVSMEDYSGRSQDGSNCSLSNSRHSTGGKFMLSLPQKGTAKYHERIIQSERMASKEDETDVQYIIGPIRRKTAAERGRSTSDNSSALKFKERQKRRSCDRMSRSERNSPGEEEEAPGKVASPRRKTAVERGRALSDSFDAGVNRRHGRASIVANHDKMSRSERIVEENGSPRKDEGPARRKTAVEKGRSHSDNTEAIKFKEERATDRRRATEKGRNFSGGRGKCRDRVRSIHGQNKRASIIAANNIPTMMFEDERQKKDEARKEEIEKIKKAVLARGDSVDGVLAATIKNSPELLEKLLLEVMDHDDIVAELSNPRKELVGPPSVLRQAEGTRPGPRRSSMLERSGGKRQVRAATRDSIHAPSGIQPGTYHSAVTNL